MPSLRVPLPAMILTITRPVGARTLLRPLLAVVATPTATAGTQIAETGVIEIGIVTVILNGRRIIAIARAIGEIRRKLGARRSELWVLVVRRSVY